MPAIGSQFAQLADLRANQPIERSPSTARDGECRGPCLVAKTDFVAALSRRVAEPFASPLRLRLLPPPIALSRGRVGQLWHEQMETDPGHRWFRELVARVATRL